MSTVKDLVDEHFARSLSTVANRERASPPLQESQPEHSPPNRGIKRKQDQLISPTHSTSSTPSHSPVPHAPTPLIPFCAPSQQDNKGLIVYPEFVQFLVHPNVDPFRDIPRLPGQSDKLACTPRGWQMNTEKDKPNPPPSCSNPSQAWYTPRAHLDPLLLSPQHGPDLTREDLKAILELNDNVI